MISSRKATARLLTRRLFAPAVVAALAFWAQSASALVSYSIDDGTAENSVGVGGNGGDAIFLNEFPIQAGGNLIASISVAFGDPTTPQNLALIGHAYSVVLYSDPNGDGNPTDGQLLAFAPGVITSVNSDTFLTSAITPTTVSGSDFFVGFEIQNQPANTFPAAIDTTTPTYPGRSFVTYGNAGTIDPFNLGANQVPPETIESVPGAPIGNWLIRANTPVPEASTWAYVLGGLACGGLIFRRRVAS